MTTLNFKKKWICPICKVKITFDSIKYYKEAVRNGCCWVCYARKKNK